MKSFAVSVGALVWCAPWALGACSASTGKGVRTGRDGRDGRDEGAVTASHVDAPPDVALVSACVPTGPELCFNATDDNCNGVIDEGCGVGTGVLQFTIAWSEASADVDLVVREPGGQRVFEGNRASSTGLRLDRDCPGEGCNGQNVENVFFEGLEPPRGRYEAEVRLADLHGVPPPIRVRFGARIGARTFAADVTLSQTDEKKTFGFDL